MCTRQYPDDTRTAARGGPPAGRQISFRTNFRFSLDCYAGNPFCGSGMAWTESFQLSRMDLASERATVAKCCRMPHARLQQNKLRGRMTSRSRRHLSIRARDLRKARFRPLRDHAEGRSSRLALYIESDPLISIVMVLPPIPIRVLIGLVAQGPVNVVAMRFILPLRVMAVLSRSIDPMPAAASAQERNHQCRRKQTTTKFVHANSFRVIETANCLGRMRPENDGLDRRGRQYGAVLTLRIGS